MKLLKYLPQFLRLKLIRRNIHIPDAPQDFQVCIATTEIELEKSYSLLHDCYVGNKLMAPDASGLRCNFYSFLPFTTTIVAKIGNNVVGTVSLIKDSSSGLPSDKNFKYENDLLRIKNKKLVEVSSLAIDPQYRKKAHIVSLFLMKYLQHYCTHHMGVTTVTCVVHPRARDFYAAFWGFTSNKKVVKYKFVNNALGIHVFGDITDENLQALNPLFPAEANKNPINFLMKQQDFLNYPVRKFSSHVDPIYTPQLLKYFMAVRTQAFVQLSRTELLTIYSAYCQFFENLEDLDFFTDFDKIRQEKRDFRFPLKIAANLKLNKRKTTTCSIMDLTHEGAFLSTEIKLDFEKEYWIEFQLGSEKFSFQVTPRWQNRRSRNHQDFGYGIQFKQTQLNILRILRKTHLSIAPKIAK